MPPKRGAKPGSGRGPGRPRLDPAFVPKQKVMKFPGKNRGGANARTTSGRSVKPTNKRAELREEDLYEPDDDVPLDGSSDTIGEAIHAPVSKSRINRSVGRSPEDKGAFGFKLKLSMKPDPDRFIKNIHSDVTELFDFLTSKDVQTELPNLSKPSPNPEFADDDEHSIEDTYTSEKLFQLYILAYARNEYHLCDLVADIWIRAFQQKDANPKIKIWKENRSKYKVEQRATAPPSDNGDPLLHHDVTTIDLQRLSDLYDNTGESCGARNLWADAMALCGGWLEGRLAKHGLGRESWPPALVWDVMNVSLRMCRIRLTLKIEENHPKEWCDRYHEHGKHGSPCYRVVAQAQREFRERGEHPEMTDMDGGGYGGSYGKRVSFADGMEGDYSEEE